MSKYLSIKDALKYVTHRKKDINARISKNEKQELNSVDPAELVRLTHANMSLKGMNKELNVLFRFLKHSEGGEGEEV